MTALIQARGLRKSFGTTDALRGIDLDIHRGEVIAVMGPSGSGKSSLLHCLAGVLVPDGGTVIVDGITVSALNEARRSALRLTEFGFVFQFGQLLPDLTAVDNITIPLLLGGMRRRQALKEAHGWLDRLGLETAAAKLPGELSGGEAQRIAIARALVAHPSVLFADEPTGSLDSLAAENVLTAMLELVRQAGTTLVMITHDPRTAAYADREIIVRDGQLAAGDRVGIS
ncbi:ABC transporter ATP-binding protein [Cryobacterium sp. Hb1]|uniref:ABC transporter ATP-binding protein n=1 Tax=Cryobacterium sp. Hb1 TaxID=1259147 RepID=UPI001068E675|nr:ABC transporter ATP-binding protein [Cryobacterium sp. Hb1]TFD71082.1 ABC transporter ATP-binding protein [Cryobacterium sp. Hb1]